MEVSVTNSSLSSKDSLLKTAYLGHIINPTSEDAFEDFEHGALIVDQSGQIAALGHWHDLKDNFGSAQVVDFGSQLLMPGMIDMHLHLPQFPQIGKSGEHLLGWLEKYIYPAEARFSNEKHAETIARWFFKELAASGTTCGVVFTTIHGAATDIAFRVAEQMGSRVIMGKVLMDKRAPDYLCETVSQAVEESTRLCEKWHGKQEGRLMYAFTPRFAVSCSEQLLRETGKMWQAHPGSYMHTHLSESQEEIRLVASDFPDRENYFDVYAHFGLVGSNAVFAHAIHLDDSVIARIRKSDSALAHCPSSNFFLKSGVFPYRRLHKAGVRFGLGSDVAAGPHMNLFQVMKDANFIQPDNWISPVELFYRATLAGAKALNIADRVGNLEVGKDADFIVVDPTRKSSTVDDILAAPAEEILSTLVFAGDDRMVAETFVRGQSIWRAQA